MSSDSSEAAAAASAAEAVAPSRPSPGLYLCAAAGYAGLAFSAFQFHQERPMLELALLLLALFVHFLNSVLSAFRLQMRTANELALCVVLPSLLFLPFHFASHFHVRTGFFQLRWEAVAVAVAALVAAGLVQTAIGAVREGKRGGAEDDGGEDEAERAALAIEPFTFSFVSEILVNFVSLGLGLLLWSEARWVLLMLGAAALFITLVFNNMPTDLGRIVFYTAVLLTEQELRRDRTTNYIT